MKREIIKKSVGIFMFAGFILVAVAAAPVYSQETLGGGYQFGPGLAQTISDEVTLRIPARTNVGIIVVLQRNLSNSHGIPVTTDVNVAIEVFNPAGGLAISQTASATVVQAGLQIPTISFPGIYVSQRGCPGYWKVKIRTTNNAAPKVRVFGTVTFAFVRPGTVNLAMEGGTLNLNRNSNTTKTLTGKDLTTLNRNLIVGTGNFQIKAKWHTDPADIFKFNQYFPLKVELLRPDGTVAAKETGFSQHAPSEKTPKVNFSYTANAQDAAMPGTWKLKVTSPLENPRIVSFDVERGFDINSPSFNSTFSAQCSESVTVG